MLTLEIQFPGNPDFLQFSPVAPTHRAEFSTLSAAIRAAMSMRDNMMVDWDIDFSNWSAFVYGKSEAVRISWSGVTFSASSGARLTQAEAARLLGVKS